MANNSTDLKLRKQLPKPLMLKDYLLDDLSSCSSNGFKLFPRSQCCTTVRFLLEIDIAKNAHLYKKKELLKSRSKSASSVTRSAFQRASSVVIHAVKQLPFAGCNSLTKKILPRSFSRKFLKRSFWKRTHHKEIKRLKSFGEEKSKPSDCSPVRTTKSTITTVSTTESTSSTNDCCSNNKSDSWSDREFTSSDYLQRSSGNSEINFCVNEVESKRFLPEMTASKSVGVTAGECSAETSTASTANYSADSTKKEWLHEEEKEQFSPVSVLDFPFDDEDEVSSPFQHDLVHTKGSKQKLPQKTRRIGSLSQIEPLDLEKRIALSESIDESLKHPSLAIQNTMALDKEEDEDNIAEQNAVELLKKMNTTMPSVSFKFNPNNLLIDFFRETNTFDSVALDVARDWVSGQPRELLLGWEVQKSREAYIKNMEKGGKWRDLDEDKREVVLELGDEVLTDLVNEFILDL
ncbi:hypothetical protein LguiA_015589 [Lonicera macranthoides]